MLLVFAGHSLALALVGVARAGRGHEDRAGLAAFGGVDLNHARAGLAASAARGRALLPLVPGRDFAVDGAIVGVAVALLGEIHLGAGEAAAPTFVDLWAGTALLAAATSGGAGGPGGPRAGEAVERLAAALLGAGKVGGPEKALHGPDVAGGKRGGAVLALGAAVEGHVLAGFAVHALGGEIGSLELALGAVDAAGAVATLVSPGLAAFAYGSFGAGELATGADVAGGVSAGSHVVACVLHVGALGAASAGNLGGDVELASRALAALGGGASGLVESAVGAVVAAHRAVVALELAHGAGGTGDGAGRRGEGAGSALLAGHGRFGGGAGLVLASGAGLAHAGGVLFGVRALGADEAATVPVNGSGLVGTFAASDAGAGRLTGAADAHVAGRADLTLGALGCVEGVLVLAVGAGVADLLVAGTELADGASLVVAALPELRVGALRALGAGAALGKAAALAEVAEGGARGAGITLLLAGEVGVSTLRAGLAEVGLGHVLVLAGVALDAAVHDGGEGLGVLARGAVVALGHARSRLELALRAADAVAGILNGAFAVGAGETGGAGRISGVGVVALGAGLALAGARGRVSAGATGGAVVVGLLVVGTGRAGSALASALVGDETSRALHATVGARLLGELADGAKLASLVRGIGLEGADRADLAGTSRALSAADALLTLGAVAASEALSIPLVGNGLVLVLEAVHALAVLVNAVSSKLLAEAAQLVVDALLTMPANGIEEVAEAGGVELASLALGAALLGFARELALGALGALSGTSRSAVSARLAGFALGEADLSVTVVAGAASVALVHASLGLSGTIGAAKALGLAFGEVARLAGLTLGGTFFTAGTGRAGLAAVLGLVSTLRSEGTGRALVARGHAPLVSVGTESASFALIHAVLVGVHALLALVALVVLASESASRADFADAMFVFASARAALAVADLLGDHVFGALLAASLRLRNDRPGAGPGTATAGFGARSPRRPLGKHAIDRTVLFVASTELLVVLLSRASNTTIHRWLKNSAATPLSTTTTSHITSLPTVELGHDAINGALVLVATPRLNEVRAVLATKSSTHPDGTLLLLGTSTAGEGAFTPVAEFSDLAVARAVACLASLLVFEGRAFLATIGIGDESTTVPNPHATTAGLIAFTKVGEFTHDAVNRTLVGVAAVVLDEDRALLATVLCFTGHAPLALLVTSTTAAGARLLEVPRRNFASDDAGLSVALANLLGGGARATTEGLLLNYATLGGASATAARLGARAPSLPLTHFTVEGAVVFVAVSELLMVRASLAAIQRFTRNGPSPHFKTTTARLRADRPLGGFSHLTIYWAALREALLTFSKGWALTTARSNSTMAGHHATATGGTAISPRAPCADLTQCL